MKTGKVTKFFSLGALMLVMMYFISGKVGDKVLIAGLIFAGLAMLSAIAGNIMKKREKYKTEI